MLVARLQIIWSKINWLIGAINLTPWYLTYNGGGPSPPSPVVSCTPLHPL